MASTTNTTTVNKTQKLDESENNKMFYSCKEIEGTHSQLSQKNEKQDCMEIDATSNDNDSKCKSEKLTQKTIFEFDESININMHVEDNFEVPQKKKSLFTLDRRTLLNLEESFDYASIDFNIFQFSDKVGRKQAFGVIFEHILDKVESRYIYNDDITVHKINHHKLKKFIPTIQNGYISTLPYHNELHGADVCQTLFSWFNFTGIAKTFELTYIDLISAYTAALVHDFRHPGFNNTYLLNTRSDLAITYNDKSILENFHVSESFKVILKEDCNIFCDFTNEEFNDIRKRMIEAILCTDMSCHFQTVSILKGKMDYLDIKEGKNIGRLISNDEKDPNKAAELMYKDQQLIINYFVHCADISHNVKDWSISEKWSNLIYEEFFNQGDVEKSKNLKVSMFCDREKTNIPDSQIGFLKVIIVPAFELLIRMFPNFNKIMNNINKNNEIWVKLKEEKAKEKEKMLGDVEGAKK
jgi:hypothetical protein